MTIRRGRSPTTAPARSTRLSPTRPVRTPRMSSRRARPRKIAPPPPAPTGAATSQLAAGPYKYRITYVDGNNQESNASAVTATTADVTSGQYVALVNIPKEPAGTTARRIYRFGPGDTSFALVGTLA